MLDDLLIGGNKCILTPNQYNPLGSILFVTTPD